MSTSCRCWWVWAWYSRSVESKRMDTHTPSPIHASCRTWLSRRGCASNDFCGVTAAHVSDGVPGGGSEPT